MAHDTWTLGGSLHDPAGEPLTGAVIVVELLGGILNDPAGDDLRASQAVGIVTDTGALVAATRGARGALVAGIGPLVLACAPGRHYSVTCSRIATGNVIIASPAAGATLTLDDVFTALAVSPPAAGVVQPALDAIDARLDALEAGGAGGGVTDHGALTGLGDDDHPQYTTAAEAAAAAPVQSVAGRAGAVTLTQADVGLAAVDNTADADKPISTATATALAGKAATAHTHTAAQVADSTAVGRSVLTAADAAAARTAIGAGTSSLAIGTTVGTAAEGNDPRLSDARTPAAHAASHAAAGSDPVTVTALAAGSTDASKVLAPTVGGGLQWVTPTGGGAGFVDVMRPKVGGHLAPRGSANGSTIGPFATGAVSFVPLSVGIGMTVDAMVIRAGTTEAVNVRALLYSSDSDGYPASLVTSGTGACSSTYITLSFTPVALAAGLYWACLRTDAGSAVRFFSVAAIGPTVTDATLMATLPFALQADPGTYASPAATLAAWTHTYGTPSPFGRGRRCERGKRCRPPRDEPHQPRRQGPRRRRRRREAPDRHRPGRCGRMDSRGPAHPARLPGDDPRAGQDAHPPADPRAAGQTGTAARRHRHHGQADRDAHRPATRLSRLTQRTAKRPPLRRGALSALSGPSEHEGHGKTYPLWKDSTQHWQHIREVAALEQRGIPLPHLGGCGFVAGLPPSDLPVVDTHEAGHVALG